MSTQKKYSDEELKGMLNELQSQSFHNYSDDSDDTFFNIISILLPILLLAFFIAAKLSE